TLPPSVSQSAPQLSTHPAARATKTGVVRIPILVTEKGAGRLNRPAPGLSTSLEPEPRRQNRAAWIDLRACDGAEVRIGLCARGEVVVQQVIRVARVEMVERIESLHAEFERFAFRDASDLSQREVEIPQ